MRGSSSVGPILGRRWPKPFGRLGPTCVRRRRVPIASQCRPVERKSDVGEEVTTAAEPTFWMIFNLQNQTTDRATPTDRRSRHASGQKLRDCEDAGCSTCGRFARRARVSAGNDPTTPPLRQRGIWPHSHAFARDESMLDGYPKSAISFRASRPRYKGRIAIVTDVGAGCGGRGSVRRVSGRRAIFS